MNWLSLISLLFEKQHLLQIVLKFAVAVAGVAFGGLGLISGGISLLGFGASGVAAGSTAAAWQSSVGAVAAGSLFSSCQSIGAAGFASSTFGAVMAAIGAIIAAIFSIFGIKPWTTVMVKNCILRKFNKDSQKRFKNESIQKHKTTSFFFFFQYSVVVMMMNNVWFDDWFHFVMVRGHFYLHSRVSRQMNWFSSKGILVVTCFLVVPWTVSYSTQHRSWTLYHWLYICDCWYFVAFLFPFDVYSAVSSHQIDLFCIYNRNRRIIHFTHFEPNVLVDK